MIYHPSEDAADISQPLATPWESTAAAQLQHRLVESAALIAECKEIASGKKADRVGGLNAAAKIMMANAALASMLQRLIHGETRHRSIVEQIQAFPQPGRQLNSKKSDDEIMASLERKFQRIRDQMDAEEREEADRRFAAHQERQGGG